MLRPVRANRCKRWLLHAWAAGAEPRHTRQGCRHPCVSAASRLTQPFCTRPPDLSGAYPLDVLLPAVLFSPLPELAKRRTALGPPISTFRPPACGQPLECPEVLAAAASRGSSCSSSLGHRGRFPFKTFMATPTSLDSCVCALEGCVLVFWRAVFFGFLLPFRIFPSPSATRCLADISLLRSFSARALCRSGGQRNRVALVRGKAVCFA